MTDKKEWAEGIKIGAAGGLAAVVGAASGALEDDPTTGIFVTFGLLGVMLIYRFAVEHFNAQDNIQAENRKLREQFKEQGDRHDAELSALRKHIAESDRECERRIARIDENTQRFRTALIALVRSAAGEPIHAVDLLDVLTDDYTSRGD